MAGTDENTSTAGKKTVTLTVTLTVKFANTVANI